MKKGQTLAEVIVVVAVVLLLITGLIAGATASLKSAGFSRSKSLSVRYAEEAVELARGIRDGGWENFLSFSNKSWCLNKTGTWTENNGSCPVNIDNIYTRSVTFTWQDPKMKIDVSVSWQDGGKTFTTDTTTYLTQWR